MSQSAIAAYLSRNDLALPPEAVEEAVEVLLEFVADAGATIPAAPDLDTLYTYRVPEVSEDGSCSIFDELAPEPHDLGVTLGGRTPHNTRKLWLLNQLVAQVNAQLGADWLGIYQRLPVAAGEALVKLAYVGLPSRAEFPLTEAFAAQSNNTTVGLSGKGLVIQDVVKHADAGGSYYVCDPKVKSEVCLPVYADSGEVIGIIDAEAADTGFFDPTRQTLLVALCLVLPELF